MIVFDLQALQSAAHGGRGIGRYVFDLARTLQAEHDGVVDVFAWNDRLPSVATIGELDLGDRLVAYSDLKGATVDVLHVNSPFEMLDYDVVSVPVTANRLVVTCYDLIPYRFSDVYLADPTTSARYRTRLGLLVSADAIVTDSRSAADDLIELLGVDRRRLTVIGAGVGERFVPPVDSHADRIAHLAGDVAGLATGYLLVPAGMDWRKNAAGTIAAYAALPDAVRASHQLVLSCAVQPGYEAWLRQLAADAGVADRLVITGHVSDATLVELYQTAELVCFPSYYEGFGLPLLEALHCGARVISSDMSSLPEIVRDRAALFDPWDVSDITRALAEALTDPSRGARLTEPRFTWSATAAALVDVYRCER